jgi:hypothetical protein
MSKEFDAQIKKLMAQSKREWDLKEKKRKEKEAQQPKSIDGKLTDQQVENWRRILFGTIGPYALIMPRDEIQKCRDRLQAGTDALDKELR